MTEILKGKSLEIVACKYFICPNLSKIDEICEKLFENENIADETQLNELKELSPKIAVAFFKKTYRHPNYVPRSILIGSIYIAGSCIKTRYPISQYDLGLVTNVSSVTIRKWYRKITEVLGIKDLCNHEFTAEEKNENLKNVMKVIN